MTWLHPVIDWMFAEAALQFKGNPVALLVLATVHRMLDKWLFGAAHALSAKGLNANSPLTDIIDAAFAYFEAQMHGISFLIQLLQEANKYIDQWVAGSSYHASAKAKGLVP